MPYNGECNALNGIQVGTVKIGAAYDSYWFIIKYCVDRVVGSTKLQYIKWSLTYSVQSLLILTVVY